MDKFITHEITIAAYLMGVKEVKLLSATKDENDRFKIKLDVIPTEAQDMLYDFPTSESMKYDRYVKFLKGILCAKPRRHK